MNAPLHRCCAHCRARTRRFAGNPVRCLRTGPEFQRGCLDPKAPSAWYAGRQSCDCLPNLRSTIAEPCAPGEPGRAWSLSHRPKPTGAKLPIRLRSCHQGPRHSGRRLARWTGPKLDRRRTASPHFSRTAVAVRIAAPDRRSGGMMPICAARACTRWRLEPACCHARPAYALRRRSAPWSADWLSREISIPVSASGEPKFHCCLHQQRKFLFPAVSMPRHWDRPIRKLHSHAPDPSLLALARPRRWTEEKSESVSQRFRLDQLGFACARPG